MENVIIISIQILMLIALGLLYYTLKNLLPGYFDQKGKNIATKEDISEITELVEAAKQTFTAETEKLKATLLVVSNIQVGIISEERNVIVDMNEKYFKWVNNLMDTSLNNIDIYNNHELDIHYQKVNEYYSDLLSSEAKFTLFIENKPLLESLNKLRMESLNKLAPLILTYISSLKPLNLELEYMQRTETAEQLPEKRAENFRKRNEAHSEFQRAVLDGYKSILELKRNFQQLCREHIYGLLTEDNEAI